MKFSGRSNRIPMEFSTRFCNSVQGLPFCTRRVFFVVAQQTSAVCQWVLSLPCQQGARGERARRYSLPDLPRGDQLPALLALSARPGRRPVTVARACAARLAPICSALHFRPPRPRLCAAVPAPGVSTASPGAMDASMLLSPAAYWAHAASGSTAWALVADSRSAAAGVRDDFATGADSARNRSGGRW